MDCKRKKENASEGSFGVLMGLELVKDEWKKWASECHLWPQYALHSGQFFAFRISHHSHCHTSVSSVVVFHSK